MSLRQDSIRVPTGLAILMAVQLACAAFFMIDAVQDMVEDGVFGFDWHLGFETLATTSLLIAIALEGRFLLGLLRRKEHLEESLRNASDEVHEVISTQFREWRLSPAESDIAMFLVKGLGTQEIAEMRGSAEGTVKAHFNAIFRKAGVHSRAELLSVLIDRLLGGRLEDSSEVSELLKSG